MISAGLALEALLFAAQVVTAPAEPATPDAPAEEQPAEPASALGSCLDRDFADGPMRQGVQKRDFMKKHRAEVAALGGLYASDVVSSTWIAGGSLSYFIAEDFGLEVFASRSPVKFRLEEPFSGFDRERRFAPRAAWQGLASLLFSPIHAKFRAGETHIVHGDVVFSAGVGRTDHASVQGLTYTAGVGVRLHLARYLSFHVELRDFMMAQEVLGRGRITNNVGVLTGLGGWTP